MLFGSYPQQLHTRRFIQLLSEVLPNSCEEAEICTTWLIYISGERKKENPQNLKHSAKDLQTKRAICCETQKTAKTKPQTHVS